VGELDDSFTQLLGRQASDREKQDLYRVRDALKLKPTDAVWLLLMALQHYQTLYEQIPAQIVSTAREVTKAVRATAEAEAKVAQEQTTWALMDAVRQAAARSAAQAAGAQRAKWVSIAVSVICIGLLLTGWASFSCGYGRGKAVGEEGALKRYGAMVALSSWGATPDGQLAYGLSKAGGLSEVARCSGRGMVPRDGWCTVPSERGKVIARWRFLSAGAPNRGAAQ
jgi:hypothetical protein